MKTSSWLVIILLYSIPSFGAFFNIDKTEKHELITCGFFLYLEANGMDCGHIEEEVQPNLYLKFISDLRKTYDPLSKDANWKDKLPKSYQTFEAFKENMIKVCGEGEAVCNRIKKGKSFFLGRKKCNSFCSTRTCRDMFTLATCHAMDEYGVCPRNTVKNCLNNNRPKLEGLLQARGWPTEWDNLDENWTHIFLATAPETAKGASIGVRFVEIGGVAAVAAALPFVLPLAAPLVPAVSSFIKGQLKNLVTKEANNALNQGINVAQKDITTGTKKAETYVKNSSQDVYF